LGVANGAEGRDFVLRTIKQIFAACKANEITEEQDNTMPVWVADLGSGGF